MTQNMAFNNYVWLMSYLHFAPLTPCAGSHLMRQVYVSEAFQKRSAMVLSAIDCFCLLPICNERTACDRSMFWHMKTSLKASY